MFTFPTARPTGAFILALGFALALGVGIGAAAEEPSKTAIATAKEVITAKGANGTYTAPGLAGIYHVVATDPSDPTRVVSTTW